VTRTRRIVRVGVFLLLISAIAAAILEPTGTVRAFLVGESFYRSRPLRHWREILREQGEQGGITREAWGKFWDADTVLPVLLACARDPDRNVRWPAVALIAHHGRGKREAFTALAHALKDEDVAVRLKAVNGLGSWGPMAREGTPELTDALEDKELQVCHLADIALWHIDIPTALHSSGWKAYHSREWQFSAMFPGDPEPGQQESPVTAGPIRTFSAWHKTGREISPTRYVISVSEYDEEVLQGKEEKQLLEASTAAAAFGVQGKIVRAGEVVQGGLKGREHTIDAGKPGIMRARLFWSGRRMYTVMVVYQTQFLNAKAADYFLDSFRLTEPPKPPEQGHPSNERRR
jgi:hypothetical protein